jgi:phospholipid/cholesterol/gamma-HCH transport system substrate-binding protein
MSKSVRNRLIAFVLLSAIGITYVTATYLGLVDRVTGRNITVTATLPGSGGLFVGSEVTYRGVKIGKVSDVDPTEHGIEVKLTLDHDAEVPTDSSISVHNLSAVGEQYLDFQPSDEDPPYAEDGAVFHGDESSLPVDEGALLVDMYDFVGSVDRESLQVVVHELGEMFGETGEELQTLLDSGSTFVEEASGHTDETIQLLRSGLKVLRTQSGEKENIRSFANDLATLTQALRTSDGDLRQVLDRTPGTANELHALLKDLEPTLPTLLSDLVSVDQVVSSYLPGLEQLLVIYPAIMAGGPTGSTRDGWGHINLQFDYSVPPCTKGFRPPTEWRSPHDTGDAPVYPAKCLSGAPFEARGPNTAPPGTGPNASPPRAYSGTYDPATGLVPGLVDANGNPVEFEQPANLSVLGGDAWKWMLVGPVASR